jgi:hypothetical protein
MCRKRNYRVCASYGIIEGGKEVSAMYDTSPMGIVYGPYGAVGFVGGQSNSSWITVLLAWLGLKPA